MERRRFLAASGLAGLAGLAGCSNITGTALGSIAPPQVPTAKLESGGWVLQDESHRTVFEEEYGPITVVAKAHSLVYEDEALAARVKEDTLGAVDGTLATFAATRVRFSPDLTQLPESIGRDTLVDRVEESSRQQFEARMRDAGLTNVKQVETGELQIDTGETARYTGFRAEYDVEPFSFALPGGETVRLDVDPITVAGDLAVWVHGNSILVAGGAYPAENVATTVSRDVTDAITVDVSIDLGLTPAEYESELRSLITAVE